MPKRRHFVGSYAAAKREEQVMPDEMAKTGEFFALIKDRRYQDAIAMMPLVADINAIDSGSGLNALHMAAARCSTPLLHAVWARPELDELCRDSQGRYASEIAWHVGGNEALSVQLMAREHAYAVAHGVQRWPKQPVPDQDATPS